MERHAKGATSSLDPKIISLFKKQRHLLSYSEDDFRDKVVRPLFLRIGFEGGRDTCGPSEQGKDCIFLTTNKLEALDIYCVQTKKGNLNLASKSSQNTVVAITQLRTALNTSVQIPSLHIKQNPDKVILCSSGKINESARHHILDQLKDNRIVFWDSDDLIPKLDKHYPEIWYGIDAERNPYLQGLQTDLYKKNEVIPLAELGLSTDQSVPIADDNYLPLFCHRMTSKVRRQKGKVEVEPDIEEFKVTGLLSRKERQLVLLGDAGDGKTTALRRLALILTKKALETGDVTVVPVMLRAIDILQDNKRLVDLLVQKTCEYSKEGKPALNIEDFNSGRVTVLVDALDEIAQPDDRTLVLSALTQFYDEYPKCQTILTARPYETVLAIPELRAFSTFWLSEIDIRKTKSLIERLGQGRALPAEATQEFMRQLQDVHGFKLNPLLLTIFVVTSDYRRRDVPANITELFKKFTELLLGRWDQQKGLSQQFQAPLKDFLLSVVALHMHKQRTNFITENELRQIIMKELSQRGYNADIEALMSELTQRSGLLRSDGERLEFRHFLLQEFFAGRGVKSASFFSSLVQDEWWRKAIVFYFGEHPDGEDELRTITTEVKDLKDAELYHAAISIGLAVQACYLAKIEGKQFLLNWVIKSLANTHKPFLTHLEKDAPKYPLHEFVEYYVYARDAVSCSAIHVPTNNWETFCEETKGPGAEAVQFWYIVALMEAGKLNEVCRIIKKFHPKDTRFLLALHLGAFLIAGLRISNEHERKLALEICFLLAPKIKGLIADVLSEMKGYLFEVREGKITAITHQIEDVKP